MVARTALAVLASLTVFFALGELLARGLDIVDRLNGYTRLIYMRGPSPDLPYLLRPGMQTTLLGTPVRINRFGLRGPEIAATPAPGVTRILVLGDSVVFGHGIAEDETVATVLAREMRAQSDVLYEAVNAGVPGFDTVAEVRLLEAVGMQLKPHLVVVGTSLNDYDVAPAYSPLGILTRRDLGKREPRLLDRFEFLVLARWLNAYMRGRLWYQMLASAEVKRPPAREAEATRYAGLERAVQRMHLRFYHDPQPAYWNRMRDAFAQLAHVASDHDLALLVAIFPEKYQVGVDKPDLTPQQRLLGLCRETGIRCLDLQPAFAAAGGDLFVDIQHPNARGHAVAAAAIARALLDRRGTAAITPEKARGPGLATQRENRPVKSSK